MNEIEFEQVARRAAANVRSEAAQIANSQAALAQLLAREETDRGQRTPAVVKVDKARLRRRSPWIPILIAASTIVAVGGMLLFATRDGEESLVVTTEPPQPEQPGEPSGEPDATMPEVNDPDADPDATAPQVPTTAPEAVDEGPISPFVFDVPEDIGRPLARVELLTADVGSGELELGWEDCQECEPLRPWAPVVDADGTIYIADVVNSRWRVVEQGVSTNVPFPDGEVVAGSPVIGPDGLLYAVVASELRQTAPRRVAAYDLSPFVEIASYPVGTTVFDRLELVNGQLLLGDTVVTNFGVLLGTPTIEIDHDAGVVTVSLSGTQRRFQFPEGWIINGRDAVPIFDGSVVVRVLVPAEPDGYEVVLVHLRLDGTTAAGIVADDTASNAAIQITSAGLVQLEGTNVVQYELPGSAGADPLAGWTLPVFSQPDLALVPRLLPQQPVPGVVSAIRSEGADAFTRTAYSQTWVRSDESDDVDAVVEIRTSLPRPDRWVLVHQGWSKGTAWRTFEQQDSDGTTQLEMLTVFGYPEAIGTPGLLGNRIALRSIDGRPALLFDRGWGSAVTWSPRDDLVVRLGSYGPLDQLFEIAQSVVEVDQATWEAASTIDISTNDGCSSMFC